MNNKRPNYFNGQFLKATDFLEDQAYQIATLREHNRTQHTWGIAEGLEPSFDAGSPILHISGGLAIDKEGRQIRVDAGGLDHDFTGQSETTQYVTIAYGENPDPASYTEETGVPGHTRTLEEPVLKTSPVPPADTSIDILIGVITLNIDLAANTIEIVSIDETDRRKAGVKAGDLDASSLSLVTDQMTTALWPKFSSQNIGGSPLLKIDTKDALFTGQLETSGAVGIGVEPSTVAKLQVGGALKINGNATLDQNLNVAGSANVTGALNVTGPANFAGGVSVTGDAQLSGAVHAASLHATAGASVGGDLVINGNLDVKGTTTTVNTTEMEISDNIIRVNKYAPQATPKQINGGLEVFRGGDASNPEAQILWDEAAGKWMAGKAGSLAEIPVGPLSVDANGNVGIGTAAAPANLDVRGEIIRRVQIATGLGPNDETDTGRIASRTLNFVKQYNETAIRIVYWDNIRVEGGGPMSGRWIIRIDNQDIPGGAIYQDFYFHTYAWGPQGGNIHMPASIAGYATGILQGNREIQIWTQNYVPGHPASNLFTGWNNSRWTIEAQEVWLN